MNSPIEDLETPKELSEKDMEVSHYVHYKYNSV